MKNRNFHNKSQIRVLPTAFLFLALFLLIFPLRWLLAALLSALIHELCHVSMIHSLGLQIYSVSFGPWGAKIQTEPMTPFQEFLCALAGPVGALCLVLTAKWFPRVAICAAFQSVYNLLPIYPNDGGRALRCLMQLLLPQKLAFMLCDAIECSVLLVLAFIGLYGTFRLHLGLLPLLISWILIIKTRKIPCKQEEHKVQ